MSGTPAVHTVACMTTTLGEAIAVLREH